jgi:RNA polymerase sigma factor (sigma-70 family)
MGSDQGNIAGGGLRAQLELVQPSLRRMLAARLSNAEDADDVLQDLWIKLETLDSGPIANPGAYLHRMALNLSNDLVRERARRRNREADWTDTSVSTLDGMSVDDAPSPERQASDRQELARMVEVIRAMPDRAQQVFRRHRIDGLSHSDVAAELGISKSAVEKNMATAMKHLMRHINIIGET